MKPKLKNIPPAAENLQELTDQLLLNHFSPASVLVNSIGDILYITGSTGKYLEPAKGKSNWNIYAMARSGLREVLPGGIRKAVKSAKVMTIGGIVIGTGRQKSELTITIELIKKPEPLKGMVLIVFRDSELPYKKATLKAKKGRRSQPHDELEQELRNAQDALKTNHEEMQASNEEAKSINEELQSTNEELQSTNEELTTSKEEMQSLNEELQTVNNELQIKVNDLELVTNDMKNLLRTTELATLFLDKGLNIRRFTDSVTNIFKLRDTDTGRPFTDIANDLDYVELETHSREVLKTLLPFETTILTKHPIWLRVRIVPYRTHDDRIDGLVLTFTDITELEKLKEELKLFKQNQNPS
jgi:two-component system CheB/CheR fusion protein